MMDSNLLGQSVQYHGPDLVRQLEREQQKEMLPANMISFLQKHRHKVPHISDENFQQNVKRFIAKKADILFHGVEDEVKMVYDPEEQEDIYAKMPPVESFMGIPPDQCRDHFYNSLEKHDIIIGVISSVLDSGLVLTLLCLDNGQARDIDDLKITAFCPTKELPRTVPHQSPIESFQVKDKVRGVVLNVNPENEKIIVSLMDRALPEDRPKSKLGLVNEDEFPVHYRRKLHIRGLTFDELLHSILGFNDSGNVSYLLSVLGQSDLSSLMRGLHSFKIPEKEYAESLRKSQSQKWALQSVSSGVSLFKAGKQMEAMQHLNRALQIDPTNVDALVARGALFANNESFSRAIEDFEDALRVNPQHSNARKYLYETLLAQAKIHEDASNLDDAENYYRKALSMQPESEEAMESLHGLNLKKLDKRRSRKSRDNPMEPDSPESQPAQREVYMEKTAETLKRLIHEDDRAHSCRSDVKKRKRTSLEESSPSRLRARQASLSPGLGLQRQNSVDLAAQAMRAEQWNESPPSPARKRQRGSSKHEDEQYGSSKKPSEKKHLYSEQSVGYSENLSRSRESDHSPVREGSQYHSPVREGSQYHSPVREGSQYQAKYSLHEYSPHQSISPELGRNRSSKAEIEKHRGKPQEKSYEEKSVKLSNMPLSSHDWSQELQRSPSAKESFGLTSPRQKKERYVALKPEYTGHPHGQEHTGQPHGHDGQEHTGHPHGKEHTGHPHGQEHTGHPHGQEHTGHPHGQEHQHHSRRDSWGSENSDKRNTQQVSSRRDVQQKEGRNSSQFPSSRDYFKGSEEHDALSPTDRNIEYSRSVHLTHQSPGRSDSKSEGKEPRDTHPGRLVKSNTDHSNRLESPRGSSELPLNIPYRSRSPIQTSRASPKAKDRHTAFDKRDSLDVEYTRHSVSPSRRSQVSAKTREHHSEHRRSRGEKPGYMESSKGSRLPEKDYLEKKVDHLDYKVRAQNPDSLSAHTLHFASDRESDSKRPRSSEYHRHPDSPRNSNMISEDRDTNDHAQSKRKQGEFQSLDRYSDKREYLGGKSSSKNDRLSSERGSSPKRDQRVSHRKRRSSSGSPARSSSKHESRKSQYYDENPKSLSKSPRTAGHEKVRHDLTSKSRRETKQNINTDLRRAFEVHSEIPRSKWDSPDDSDRDKLNIWTPSKLIMSRQKHSISKLDARKRSELSPGMLIIAAVEQEMEGMSQVQPVADAHAGDKPYPSEEFGIGQQFLQMSGDYQQKERVRKSRWQTPSPENQIPAASVLDRGDIPVGSEKPMQEMIDNSSHPTVTSKGQHLGSGEKTAITDQVQKSREKTQQMIKQMALGKQGQSPKEHMDIRIKVENIQYSSRSVDEEVGRVHHKELYVKELPKQDIDTKAHRHVRSINPSEHSLKRERPGSDEKDSRLEKDHSSYESYERYDRKMSEDPRKKRYDKEIYHGDDHKSHSHFERGTHDDQDRKEYPPRRGIHKRDPTKHQEMKQRLKRGAYDIKRHNSGEGPSMENIKNLQSRKFPSDLKSKDLQQHSSIKGEFDSRERKRNRSSSSDSSSSSTSSSSSSSSSTSSDSKDEKRRDKGKSNLEHKDTAAMDYSKSGVLISVQKELQARKSTESLTSLEGFLNALKDKKKQQWIAEGKVKTENP